jgi:hypothetical protein
MMNWSGNSRNWITGLVLGNIMAFTWRTLEEPWRVTRGIPSLYRDLILQPLNTKQEYQTLNDYTDSLNSCSKVVREDSGIS